MPIRPSFSTRPMALAYGIAASPDPGQPSPPGTDHTDLNAHRRHVMSQLAVQIGWLRGRIAWFAVHLMIKVLSSHHPADPNTYAYRWRSERPNLPPTA
jgi:hypothetical protein